MKNIATTKVSSGRKYMMIEALWPFGSKTTYGATLKEILKKNKSSDCYLFKVKDGGIYRINRAGGVM